MINNNEYRSSKKPLYNNTISKRRWTNHQINMLSYQSLLFNVLSAAVWLTMSSAALSNLSAIKHSLNYVELTIKYSKRDRFSNQWTSSLKTWVPKVCKRGIWKHIISTVSQYVRYPVIRWYKITTPSLTNVRSPSALAANSPNHLSPLSQLIYTSR